jgi:hypothetical protein
MKKSQLVLALGLVASGAQSVPAQSQIEMKLNDLDYAVRTVPGGGQDFYQQLPDDLVYSGLLDQLAAVPGIARQVRSGAESPIWTETAPAVSQITDDDNYSTPESAVEPAVPQSGDVGWAAPSLLLVCALATILRNSYYKVHAA